MKNKPELVEDWTAQKRNLITGWKQDYLMRKEEILRQRRWQENLDDRK